MRSVFAVLRPRRRAVPPFPRKALFEALEPRLLLSGDPAYVTSHNDARSKIRTLERDELLEELVRSYLEKGNKK